MRAWSYVHHRRKQPPFAANPLVRRAAAQSRAFGCAALCQHHSLCTARCELQKLRVHVHFAGGSKDLPI